MNGPDRVVDWLFRHYVLVGLDEVGRRLMKLNKPSAVELVGMLEVGLTAGVAELSETLRETATRILEFLGGWSSPLIALFESRLTGERLVRVRVDHSTQFTEFLALTWELDVADLREIRLDFGGSFDNPERHRDLLTRSLATPEAFALTLSRAPGLASREDRFIDDLVRLVQFVQALDLILERSHEEFRIVAWNYHARLLTRPGIPSALLAAARSLGPWTESGDALPAAIERVCGSVAQRRYALTTGSTQ